MCEAWSEEKAAAHVFKSCVGPIGHVCFLQRHLLHYGTFLVFFDTKSCVIITDRNEFFLVIVYYYY